MASGSNAVVVGGGPNSDTGTCIFGNMASGNASFVGGGATNSAIASYSTVGGGVYNTAGGVGSTVPGGQFNVAQGSESFAAGFRAKANENGMFVWADLRDFDFSPTTFRAAGQSDNTFNVRATGVGGVFFATGISATGAPSWACYAQNGSGWTCTSDRNVKRNLALLDGQAVLSQVAALPVYRWQAKDGPRAELQHIGPMAQDFYAAFALGDSDKAIGLLDASGVALAAIQGVNIRLEQKDARIRELEAKVQAQHEAVAELRRSMDVLLARSDEVALARK